MKQILVALVVVSAIGETTFGVPFGGQRFSDGRPILFTVKPGGKLVVIDGKVLCWRPKELSAKPHAVWYSQDLPSLPDELHATWLLLIDFDTPAISSEKADGDVYNLKLILGEPRGPKSFPRYPRSRPAGVAPVDAANANSKNVMYLATDEQGQAIAVTERDDRYQWQTIKTSDGWRESKRQPEDLVFIYEFRLSAGSGEERFLGLAEKPKLVKDRMGNEVELFPLILTDEKRAGKFGYFESSHAP